MPLARGNLTPNPFPRGKGNNRVWGELSDFRMFCHFFFFVVPLPDRGTASGELVALLVIVSAPPRAPRAVGKNFIVTLHFFFGAIVGPHPLAREKSPVAAMPAKVTAVVPVLVITTRFGLLLLPAPNTTLPRLRLFGDTPSEPTGVGVGVGVRVGVAVTVGVGVAVGV